MRSVQGQRLARAQSGILAWQRLFLVYLTWFHLDQLLEVSGQTRWRSWSTIVSQRRNEADSSLCASSLRSPSWVKSSPSPDCNCRSSRHSTWLSFWSPPSHSSCLRMSYHLCISVVSYQWCYPRVQSKFSWIFSMTCNINTRISLPLEANVINLSEGIQPLEFGEKILEGTTPICSIFELIFHSVLGLLTHLVLRALIRSLTCL